MGNSERKGLRSIYLSSAHLKTKIDGILSVLSDMAKSKNKNNNPRHKNGNLRRKHRARLKAIGGECGICHGRLGPIRYDEPSDAAHPLSFVIDEIHPVSRFREFGYPSPEAAANDWENLQAAHYVCNARKAARTNEEMRRFEARGALKKINLIDGEW